MKLAWAQDRGVVLSVGAVAVSEGRHSRWSGCRAEASATGGACGPFCACGAWGYGRRAVLRVAGELRYNDIVSRRAQDLELCLAWVVNLPDPAWCTQN